jgi:hypothetical protein
VYKELKYATRRIFGLKRGSDIKMAKKGIPVTGSGGPYGCETSRFPHTRVPDSRLKDGGEVVSLTRLPPYTPRQVPGINIVRSRVDSSAIVRLEGSGQLKNAVSSSGIESATFWLVP